MRAQKHLNPVSKPGVSIRSPWLTNWRPVDRSCSRSACCIVSPYRRRISPPTPPDWFKYTFAEQIRMSDRSLRISPVLTSIFIFVSRPHLSSAAKNWIPKVAPDFTAHAASFATYSFAMYYSEMGCGCFYRGARYRPPRGKSCERDRGACARRARGGSVSWRGGEFNSVPTSPGSGWQLAQ